MLLVLVLGGAAASDGGDEDPLAAAVGVEFSEKSQGSVRMKGRPW